MGLSVGPITDPSIDLFGKNVDDLQDGIEFHGTSISGTLKYVSDYTGFSSKPAEQSGNYLAIHSEVPDVDGVTITVKIMNPVTLDSDGDAVLRIADKKTQTLTVVASKPGYDSVTKVFRLRNLICESES